MKKGFTLIELVVAVALLVMVLYAAGRIFKVSIEAHRTATANAEIMQKLRAITDQLNADFKNLRKDGEIFVVWSREKPGDSEYDYDGDGYVRFDRIMFFADGDFQSYNRWPKDDPDGKIGKIVRGNVARISYMLANKASRNPGAPPVRAYSQRPEKRILARTQHILTADAQLDNSLDPNALTDLTDPLLNEWHNMYEYDKITLAEWKNVDRLSKYVALSVITDVNVGEVGRSGGAVIDPAKPDSSVHTLLCEGVGEFKVQGWYDELSRWVPEVDPYEDFVLPDPEELPGVLYPYPPYGGVVLGGEFMPAQPHAYPRHFVDEPDFNKIPGLGRALKFTFTLYDSRGIFKNGRTFTHIVYTGN